MKLFKSLLVAPATLGLLAPMNANATEVNLNEISNYSDVESIEFDTSFNNDDCGNFNKLSSVEVGGLTWSGSITEMVLIFSTSSSISWTDC